MRNTALLLAGVALSLQSASAAEIPKDQLEFFEKKVKPVLVDKCYKCHSVEAGKNKGGLLVDDRESLIKGGENGTALTPGDPAKSLLITAITYKDKDLQMPPKGEKLSDAEIEALTQWVKMGAPDPRKPVEGKLSGLTEKAKQHWAFKPVSKPALPTVKNRAWAVTPVDLFILEKIEKAGMAPSPLTDKQTLLRRATYDLTGLPPSPQDVEEFLKDNSPYAFAKVVDRLLASPAYGERWGRFWLDTARYADTTGDRNIEDNRDYRYPFAWTYRDYVVRAHNDDKPYDRFVIEQIAADQLIDLKDPRDIAALGFLTVGQRVGNENDIINDRIDVIGRGLLGLTVACARCHDHMFDPISIKDYYALHGIFASTQEPKPDELPVIADVKKTDAAKFVKEVAEIDQKNRDMFYDLVSDRNWTFRNAAGNYLLSAILSRKDATQDEQQIGLKIRESEKLDGPMATYVLRRIARETDAVTWPIKRFIDTPFEDWEKVAKEISENKQKTYNPLIASAFQGTPPKNYQDIAETYARVFKTVDAKGRKYVQLCAEAKSASDTISEVTPEEAQLLAFPLQVEPASKLTSVAIREMILKWGVQIYNRKPWLFAKVNELQMTSAGSGARAMIVTDKSKVKDSPVFLRGQSSTTGEAVPRRFLSILSDGTPKPFKKGSGRLELAQSIADKRNPLTARVLANRVWIHHFGEGFVRTPDDIGTQAEAPTHPELLDYLASYFMEQGWSMKKLHKLIMLSKIYQVSSFTVQAHEKIDPFNRMLWRANVRRLEFEAVRDSLLSFSGQLDMNMGGPPVNITDEPYVMRRSIYGYIDRGLLPELMGHFDFADPTAPNSKRTTTVVPQQALFLMNSPMVVDVARRILARKEVTSSINNQNKIFNLYRIIFQRDPKPAEIQLGLEFVGREIREEPQTLAAAKEITRKAAESVEKQEAKQSMSMGRNEALRVITNEGERVPRVPLTAWETYAQALLLSNESAYVN
jgi:hypothetical protein